MTGRDRIVVVVLAVGVVLAGVWFGLVAPRRGEVTRLNEETVAARQALDAAVQQVSAGEAAKRTYAADQALIARLGKALPAVDDSASLLYQLQDAAGRSRVSITAVTPGGGVAGAPGAPAAAAAVSTPGPGGVQTVPISLSFEGSYGDLQRFLRRVHRFTNIGDRVVAVRGRLIAVQSVDLTRAETPGAPVSATISALTYVAPTAPAPAPGTASAATTPPASAAVPPASSGAPPTTPAVIGAGG